MVTNSSVLVEDAEALRGQGLAWSLVVLLKEEGSAWELLLPSLHPPCGLGCAQASCVSLCPVVSFSIVFTLILGEVFCESALLMVEWGFGGGVLGPCPLPGWCLRQTGLAFPAGCWLLSHLF